MTSSPAVAAPKIDPRYARFRLSIRPSSIHRWGVYAEETVPARRRVIEYTGARLNRRQAKERAQVLPNYLFLVNSYWFVDGSAGGSGAEIINHSCEPNLAARIHNGRIFYHALRVIEPGEELTIDYHFSKDEEELICRCGSRNCRGTVNQ